MSAVNGEVDDTVASIACIDRSSFQDDASRSQAIAEAQAMIRRLETPVEAGIRMQYLEIYSILSLKVLFDLEILDQFAANPDTPITTPKLCARKGADPNLVKRFLRQLAAGYYVEQVSADEWKASRLVVEMAKGGFKCSPDFTFDFVLRAVQGAPEYLARKGYQNVEDREDSLWRSALQTDKPFFDWLRANPPKHENFNTNMRVMQAGRAAWWSAYPFETRVLPHADPTGPLLVDVGGGIGHDIQRLHEAFPDHPGDLILQDLPDVVANAIVKPPVKVMPHSFFDEQPIKGAAVYYMGSIMHDWPDKDCAIILGNLAKAMKKGYSRVLLREPVLPVKGANLISATMDLVMMTVLSSKERTEEDWDKLLGSVGMKIQGIWQLAHGGSRHVIEVSLADE